jgi:hypothetical protein
MTYNVEVKKAKEKTDTNKRAQASSEEGNLSPLRNFHFTLASNAFSSNPKCK